MSKPRSKNITKNEIITRSLEYPVLDHGHAGITIAVLMTASFVQTVTNSSSSVMHVCQNTLSKHTESFKLIWAHFFSLHADFARGFQRCN